MKKLVKLRLNHLAYYVRGARSRVLVYCVRLLLLDTRCVYLGHHISILSLSYIYVYTCDVCETFWTLIVIRWQCKVLHYNGLDWRGPSFVWLFFFCVQISNAVCAIVRIGHQLIILMPTLCAYCKHVADTQVSLAERIYVLCWFDGILYLFSYDYGGRSYQGQPGRDNEMSCIYLIHSIVYNS